VLVEAADLLVERTIGADERLLAGLVDHELGPLLHAGHGSADLIATLDAWLDAGLNAQATARHLELAPRTVAYRLERIAGLLGRPLDGPTVRRLGVALVGRRLLAATAAPGHAG
jgi:purine catabolism regulator